MSQTAPLSAKSSPFGELFRVRNRRLLNFKARLVDIRRGLWHNSLTGKQVVQ